MATTLNAGTATGGAAISADTTGILQLQSGSTPTTAVTIDTSQNVGIGTSSPSYKLDVRGTIGTNNNITVEDPSNTNTVGYGVGRGKIVSNGAGGFGGLTFQTYNGGFANQASIDGNGVFAFNSGYGSVATAYGCRAWVNFNGTGTPAIRASGNVSSITDNAAGDYTVNFTNAMPAANYSISGMCQHDDNASFAYNGYEGIISIAKGRTSAVSTTSCRVVTMSMTSSAYIDALIVNVSIFR
jgi:hypothetical protein